MLLPPQSAEPDRLLACTPGRVVVRTHDPTTGQVEVCKWFEHGTLADAERELAFARLAPADGVVPQRGAGCDERTGRPFLRTGYVAASNLAEHVRDHGPLLPAAACRLLLPIARTLAAMHRTPGPGGATGFCHGDLKPGNILVTGQGGVLLDFEHARWLADPAPGAAADPNGPVAGTPGFAPPEAATGAPPTASADVFGIGATLRFALAGAPRAPWRLPRELHALLRDCLQSDPARRPAAAAVADRLMALAAVPDPDPDVALAPRRERLARWRLDADQEAAAALAEDPAGVLLALRRTRLLLRGEPRHAGLLARRRALLAATTRLLADSATATAKATRQEQFAAGDAHLAALQGLLAVARCQPGGMPLPQPAQASQPEPLQRHPERVLAALRQRLAAERDDLAAVEANLDTAEASLDLATAEQALQQLAAARGGASPAASRRRDQLHRLHFHLERIGRASDNVERLAQVWDAAALQPLATFAQRCAQATAGERRDTSTTSVGLRSLSVTLTNLVDEFPHLASSALTAREALDAALRHTTELAWDGVADANRLLTAVPVPVRPIQLTLARLDALRILEAFVDQPERPRSELVDAIERLRLRWEEARSARDRLTHSAERAIARGHWTTGLFDMERAIASLGDSDGQEAQRLAERLAEARRKKQELDTAVRRNVELAARYAALLDDPLSDPQARQQCLDERRDLLQLLLVLAPNERASLYARDLRDVAITGALERASQAESEFDRTTSPSARLALARRTTAQLDQTLQELAPHEAPPGRIVRAAEHWRSVATQVATLVAAEQESRRRQSISRRRRAWLLGAVGAMAAFAALEYAPWPWGEPPVLAAPDAGRADLLARVAADPRQSLAGVEGRHEALPAAARIHLHQLVQAFRGTPDATVLTNAAQSLRGVPGEALAAAHAGAAVSEVLLAGLCLVEDRSAASRAAAEDLLAAAAARALWQGPAAVELLQQVWRQR